MKKENDEEEKVKQTTSARNALSSQKTIMKNSARFKEMDDKFQEFDSLCQVFEDLEMELIACAFKKQLLECRQNIVKLDLLKEKSKFDQRVPILEQYRLGLTKEMIEKGRHQEHLLQEFCIEVAGSAIP